MRNLRTRLQGLAATLTIVLLVAGTPAVLIAIGAAPVDGDLSRLWPLLTSPDDGTLALVLFGIVAWLAWTVMVILLAVETAAHIRGSASPRLRGLGVPQQFAGRLVAVAALAFVVAPTVAPVFAPPPAAAATPPQTNTSGLVEVASVLPAVPTKAATQPPLTAPAEEAQTVNYTVRRGDSLWKIAKEQLGDAKRYTEIHALNRDRLGERPDFIPHGIVLRLPSDHTPEDPSAETHSVIVEPGDTLSQIALDQLGDPDRYTDIADASRDTAQPDGTHLSDPNMIKPGWKLTIPSTRLETEPPPNVPLPQTSRTSDQARSLADTPERSGDPGNEIDTPPPSVDESVDSGHESWLVPGLTGAGAALAGSLFLAFLASRRSQLRRRAPGRSIAGPPDHLRDVERTLTFASASSAHQITAMHALLRTLTSGGATPPRLQAVELGDTSVTLHLDEPVDLPSPWRGEATTWSATLAVAQPQLDSPAPYAMLVSVGSDEHGSLWFVDLELPGRVNLVGDRERSLGLARHICAELALNPWSTLVRTDAVGLGPELTDLDPIRLRVHSSVSASLHSLCSDEFDTGGDTNEIEDFRVLVADARSPEAVEPFPWSLADSEHRTGRALVTLSSEGHGAGLRVSVDHEGRLHVLRVPVELTAASLSAEDAETCAAIARTGREADLLPASSVESAKSLSNAVGVLRADLMEPRTDDPAGPRSLLPASAERYEDCAATTREDVAVVAPLATAGARKVVEEADPELDADAAIWFSAETAVPRLTLLGPVSAKAVGDYKQIAERTAYFVEMLAYLALHPEGVPAAAVAEAFSISASRARTDIGFVRSWLADNPRVGRPHLPPANASQAFKETGVPMYQLEGVLTDVDLFRRLRARGQARGEAGMTDLVTALRLVAGEPFSKLRERGWSWLLDGERLHETVTIGIVDTAHIVVTDGLERGDLEQAQRAADTACLAAPYDEIARLDRIKVAQAAGHHELAERWINDDIVNRTDDHLPPIDLPERTKAILSRAKRTQDRPAH